MSSSDLESVVNIYNWTESYKAVSEFSVKAHLTLIVNLVSRLNFVIEIFTKISHTVP
jgi:hypothetical protein